MTYRGFWQLFEAACGRSPDAPLAIYDGAQPSFSQHLDRVGRVAGVLRREFGVRQNSRFAVLARNSLDYLELVHAGLAGAGTIVPLNVRASHDDLRAIVNDAECRILFVDDEFVATGQQLQRAGVIDRLVLIRARQEKETEFTGLVADSESVLPACPNDLDPAFLMYTSGTTGRPKGVRISHRALTYDIYKCASVTRPVVDYTYLLHAPFFHIGSVRGWALAPAFGACAVILPRFNEDAIVSAIRDHAVDATSFVASTVPAMLEHPDFCARSLPTLQTISYGSAPMNRRVLERLMRAFPNADLVNWYGMTETCGHVSVLTPEDHRRNGRALASCGRPLPGTRVKVLDQSGRPQQHPGSLGELWVAGDHLMDGYWNGDPLPEDEHGVAWLRTKDLARIDKDGYIHLAGRVDDMIVSGGENVWPAEVEEVLGSHPDVRTSVVFGVDDAKWGEVVHACVTLGPDAAADETALRAHCREQLAGFKVPKVIDVQAQDFPLGATNKIDRKRVKLDYLARVGLG